MGRRKWFYWTLLGTTGIDIADAFLKSGVHYVTNEDGPLTWSMWLVSVIACVVGLRSTRLRYHQVWAGIVLLAELVQSFVDVPTLGLR